MKYKDLTKKLRRLGWWDTKTGSKHEKWTNGEQIVTVPRHKEINEMTARGILKQAKGE